MRNRHRFGFGICKLAQEKPLLMAKLEAKLEAEFANRRGVVCCRAEKQERQALEAGEGKGGKRVAKRLNYPAAAVPGSRSADRQPGAHENPNPHLFAQLEFGCAGMNVSCCGLTSGRVVGRRRCGAGAGAAVEHEEARDAARQRQRHAAAGEG